MTLTLKFFGNASCMWFHDSYPYRSLKVCTVRTYGNISLQSFTGSYIVTCQKSVDPDQVARLKLSLVHYKQVYC